MTRLDAVKWDKRMPALIALASALLFGASTPAAKLLLGDCEPQLLAGFLYGGSGIGLMAWRLFAGQSRETLLKKADLPCLTGAILFGGIFAPLLLMLGLIESQASTVSLLLNSEVVMTALLAWIVFKENFDRRIFLGMISIVLGCVLLSWQTGATTMSIRSLAIIGACFCWAIDNNLTQKISNADPVQTASIKGLTSGFVNIVTAVFCGAEFPPLLTILKVSTVGFLGYGVSLVLFIKALRWIGTARTGAYFSTAPFAGAILSLVFFREEPSLKFIIAGCFMALGVWLHVSENHNHEHKHEEFEHEHLHSHDEHHKHDHGFDCPPGAPHSHRHKHDSLRHAHSHFPDSHHNHEHV